MNMLMVNRRGLTNFRFEILLDFFRHVIICWRFFFCCNSSSILVDEEYLKGLTPQVIITKTEPIFDNDDPDNSISFPDGGYNDCK